MLQVAHMRALAHENRKEIKRFAKFATVGAAGSVTDFAVLNVLIQFFGFQLWLANSFSFTIAVIQNFILNRRWTFPESRNRNAGRQLTQFAIVSMIGLAINQAVFLTIHHLTEPYWMQFIANPDLAHAVSYNVAKLFAIGVVLFWNFGVNRLWTYRGL